MVAEHGEVSPQLHFPAASNPHRTSPSFSPFLGWLSNTQQISHRGSTNLCSSSSSRNVPYSAMMSAIRGLPPGWCSLWPPQHLAQSATRLGIKLQSPCECPPLPLVCSPGRHSYLLQTHRHQTHFVSAALVHVCFPLCPAAAAQLSCLPVKCGIQKSGTFPTFRLLHMA